MMMALMLAMMMMVVKHCEADIADNSNYGNNVHNYETALTNEMN